MLILYLPYSSDLEGISMNIELFKKLGMTFGAVSAIFALYVEIHELWTRKELE
jgi:hypothetical protein